MGVKGEERSKGGVLTLHPFQRVLAGPLAAVGLVVGTMGSAGPPVSAVMASLELGGTQEAVKLLTMELLTAHLVMGKA